MNLRGGLKRRATDVDLEGFFKNYKDEWNLDNSQIQTAVRLASKDNIVAPDIEDDKVRLFLYAKAIFSTEEFPKERTLRYNAILHPQTKELQSAFERLTRIVTKGETPKPTPESSPTSSRKSKKAKTTHYKSFFAKFVEDHPEWGDGKGVFIVFRDHPELKGKSHALVERFQKSGLCYMHACVVLQHYLVAMNQSSPTPMLNMAEYLKKYMPSPNLYDHIWNDKGGDSWDFFKNILPTKPHPREFINILTFDDNSLSSNLERYGPALVSGFTVTNDFSSPNKWQHFGEYYSKKLLGRHAMVLVGYRTDDKGKILYLLQNWWKDKPYVEVDADYLLSSDPIIHFLKEKQLKMGVYPENYECFVECGLDVGENFLPENQ